MKYALIQDNFIIKWGTTKELWPNITFSSKGPNEKWLEQNNAKVIVSDLSYDKNLYYLKKCDPYIDTDGNVYDRELVTKPEPLSQPEWVSFGESLALNENVNVLIATCAQSAPVLHLSLGVGMGQAAQGDTQTFISAWKSAFHIGLISEELIIEIVSLARQFNLPEEFITQLNIIN